MSIYHQSKYFYYSNPYILCTKKTNGCYEVFTNGDLVDLIAHKFRVKIKELKTPPISIKELEDDYGVEILSMDRQKYEYQIKYYLCYTSPMYISKNYKFLQLDGKEINLYWVAPDESNTSFYREILEEAVNLGMIQNIESHSIVTSIFDTVSSVITPLKY